MVVCGGVTVMMVCGGITAMMVCGRVTGMVIYVGGNCYDGVWG